VRAFENFNISNPGSQQRQCAIFLFWFASQKFFDPQSRFMRV